MFFSRRCPAFLLALFAALSLSSCRHAPPVAQRLAILRFENLTGDDSLNWVGRAVPEVMISELRGSRAFSVVDFSQLRVLDRTLGPRPMSAPGISTERPAALLAGATRILYGRISRAGANLRLNAVLFDGSRQRMESELSVTASGAEGVIQLAGSLAKELATPVRPFGSHIDQALREYCAGLESADPHAAVAGFSHAVTADANFGQAYIAWARTAVAQNDRTEAARILSLALARGNAMSEPERARIAAMAAELRGDLPAVARALEILVRADPTDTNMLRQLAQAYLGTRRYREAEQSLRKALALQSDGAELWNDLGYAEMYAGDLQEAVKALNEYRRIRPSDPNALDSLGDVHFYFGQFVAAEQYYRQAFDKDNNFNGAGSLLKAAHARLRMGDISGADTLFHRYMETRESAKDPIVDLRQAEWEFLSGRRRQAMEHLQPLAAATTTFAAQVNAQLAIWELELGDRARAREFAQRTEAAHVVGLTAIIRFLTAPPAPPAEWKQRAMQLLPHPEDERTRNLMLGYALLLQKEFGAAVPLLSDLYQQAAPDPRESVQVLLAWAEIETGRIDEAASLVQRNPIPNPTPDLFTSLAFPRLLQLQAAVLEKQGKQQEAAGALHLFTVLSGPATRSPGDTQ